MFKSFLTIFLCLFDPWIRNKFFPDPLLTGPDLEKNGMDGGSGWGMVADLEPDWIRIQSVKCIRTRKRVMEVTQGRYGGWVGGRRVDPY